MTNTEGDLSVRQCAARTGRVAETIRLWIKRGYLPAYRIGPRGDYRVRVDDLARVFNEHR